MGIKSLFKPILLSVLLIIVICITSCSRSTKSKVNRDHIYIGAILAMTGPTSDVGKPFAAGIQDAVRHLNEEKGGINGRTVHLVVEDSGYRVSKAILAYNKIVQAFPIAALIGWGTGETEALSPLTLRDNIPCLAVTFAQNIANPQKAPNHFISGPSYTDQLEAAFRFISKSFKDLSRKPRVVFIHSDTAFGRSPFFPNGNQLASQYGIKVLDNIIVDLGDTDVSMRMADLKDLEADFAIIQETVSTTEIILKDAAKIGVKTKFIGLTWTLNEALVKNAGKDAEGFYAVVNYPAWLYQDKEEFKKYREIALKYKRSPDQLTTNYYMAFAILAILEHAISASRDDLSGMAIKKQMEQMENFVIPGYDSSISFGPQGHKPRMPLFIHQVQNGQIVIVDGPYNIY